MPGKKSFWPKPSRLIACPAFKYICFFCWIKQEVTELSWKSSFDFVFICMNIVYYQNNNFLFFGRAEDSLRHLEILPRKLLNVHCRSWPTCVIEDYDGVAVSGDLGLEGLVLLDLGLQVGRVLEALVARHLAKNCITIKYIKRRA